MDAPLTAPIGLDSARLVDKDAVIDLHHAFGQALDTDDWDLYRTCLADEVHVDYSQSSGLPATTTTAEAWTAFVVQCVQPQSTVHYYTNLRVAFLDVDTARTRLNHQSHHRVDTRTGESVNVQVGTYETTAARTASGWCLSSITHRVSWVTGNPALLDVSRPAYLQAHEAVFGRS